MIVVRAKHHRSPTPGSRISRKRDRKCQKQQSLSKVEEEKEKNHFAGAAAAAAADVRVFTDGREREKPRRIVCKTESRRTASQAETRDGRKTMTAYLFLFCTLRERVSVCPASRVIEKDDDSLIRILFHPLILPIFLSA